MALVDGASVAGQRVVGREGAAGGTVGWRERQTGLRQLPLEPGDRGREDVSSASFETNAFSSSQTSHKG